MRALDRLDDMADLRRLDDLDELGDLSRLDDLNDLGGPPPWMREGDGSVPDLRDQLENPTYSPENRDIIDADYDQLGGNSVDEFWDQYVRETPDGRYPTDWNWPPDDGKVPGSEVYLEPSDAPPMDRIGGSGGTYFTDEGAPMSERSLPPDRLNFDRTHWEIDSAHPDLASGDVRIERSEVAPWFGQEGGGNQYRFLDGEGNAIPQQELMDRGIITPPSAPGGGGVDWGAGAAGGLTTHGAQSLDRFMEQYQEGPR
jgi:hypothetical protein